MKANGSNYNVMAATPKAVQETELETYPVDIFTIYCVLFFKRNYVTLYNRIILIGEHVSYRMFDQPHNVPSTSLVCLVYSG